MPIKTLAAAAFALTAAGALTAAVTARRRTTTLTLPSNVTPLRPNGTATPVLSHVRVLPPDAATNPAVYN